LWIFIPLFWLIIQIGLGERIYDWIAKNRFLFPVPGYCPVPDQENDE
jgi:predicted DCC family thiol-disulfide oxidoreductase YuxK